MRFAIRDDDTSFFTKPEDLQQAYDFVDKGPVSLSVVPNTVPVHRDDVFPYGEDLPFGTYPIRNNSELVSFLKNGCADGKYEILLHGFSHEYHKINGQWTAEMLWKDADRIADELARGKAELEALFSSDIKVFVAPNNKINAKGIAAVETLGMDYSGIIMKNDRAFSARYLLNFIRRWTVRAVDHVPIPGVLNYGKHKELVAYTLDSTERLRREYTLSKKFHAPFVVYTHYWQLNRDPNVKEMLENIYSYALHDGAKLVGLSECFTPDDA